MEAWQIEDAVRNVLEAALSSPGQLLQHTTALIATMKDLCLHVPEDCQQDLRASLGSLAHTARQLTASSGPMEKIRLLNELGTVSNALSSDAKMLAARLESGEFAPRQLHPAHLSSTGAAAGGHSQKTEANTQPLCATESEAEDSVDPMVEESGNRLAQGLEELTQAIQQWHVGDVVALATSLVRDLPPLLHFADGSANVALGEQRQVIVQSCGAMTQFARSLVRNPEDQSLGPQILDSVATLSDGIRRFVEMLHRPVAASTSNESVHAQLQRLEAMLRTRQAAKPPVVTVSEVLGFQSAVREAYDDATTALLGITSTLASPRVDPTILGNHAEQLVLSACALFDMCDQLFDVVPMRTTTWAQVHSLTLAITPLCEPASKKGHSEAVTASLLSVRSLLPTLGKALSSLHSAATALFQQPDDLERATVLRQESFEHSSASMLLKADATSGYVEVAPSGVHDLRMDLSVTVCSRSAFDTVDEQELTSGDIMDFDDIQTTATVASIKVLIAQRCDIPEAEQDIVVHNHVLPDHAQIKDCNIGPSDLLFLFDRREVGNMVAELGIADVPVYDSPTSTPSTGAIFRQSSVRKSTVKKAEDLKRDAEHRIALMNLVKQGKMTIDEAVNQVKDSPSAAATLLVQANRKILQDAIEREQASMTAEDGFYANHEGRVRRPSKKKDTPIQILEEDMSIAGFTATSANRKFGVSDITKSRPLFFKEGYLNKEGGSRKTWRTRWFVLTSLELSYFKSPGDKAPLGVLVLENFAVVEPLSLTKAFCFGISPKQRDSRTYIIQASSDEERTEWIKAIRSALPGRRTHEERLLVLQECVDDLLVRGSKKEGIFRLPGNVGQIKRLCEKFETTENMEFEQVPNPLTVAGFLKKVFIDRKVDVLHAATQQLLERALCETSLLEEQIASIEHALEASTNVESDLMRGMMQLFAEICKNHEITKVSVDDVARSFGPILLQEISEEASRRILLLLLENAIHDF